MLIIVGLSIKLTQVKPLLVLKLNNVNFTSIFLDDVDANSISISNKGDGYKDDDCKIKLFSVIPSKTSGYVKSDYNGIKWMYFLIASVNLLKKHNNIWNKVSNSTKKNFIANPSATKNF